MSSFIEISNLKFSFSNLTKTLLDISDLKINQGEKIFLHGPSGCGKSTLLEIISGVLNFNHGEVMIDQISMSKLTPSEKDQFRSKNIGYIFQNFNLLPYLNIFENITLPLHLNGKIKNTENIQQDVKSICEKLGIADLLYQNVGQLSVGQQQRVAVARALISQPKLILADEPTSALDFDHRDKFLKLLFEICSEKKITLIFVSHDHSLKSKFDRSIEFNEINQVTP
ncbi:MAG: ABC transporter ATP-binding protein [Moraxellaceae bacterium]|nr:ABC transporter ATP-binding protein [Pseudobdellovibrionaceae bacterium]